MQVYRTDRGSVTVFSFDEDEHLNDPAPLQQAMQRVLDEGRTNILFDLQNVTYISSGVLGFFITTFRQMEKNDGNLKILNVQPCISNVFHITRMDRVMEMYNDMQTALKSFE